jgi:adenylosuccinate synthase
VAVKYSLRVSGIKHLAITKADVLSNLGELKVCTSYEINGKKVTTLPADTELLCDAKPVYETLPGWKEDLTQAKSVKELPKELISYLNFIEEYTGCKVSLISTGPGREQVIDIRKAF